MRFHKKSLTIRQKTVIVSFHVATKKDYFIQPISATIISLRSHK